MEKKDDIVSKLDSLKNTESFKVPENYFDTLLSKVQDRIEALDGKKRFEWKFSFQPVLKVSFLVAGIAFIVFLGLKTLKPIGQGNSTTTNQVNDVALYLDNQISTFDDVTILSAFSDKKEQKSKTNGQDDTINYLINNNIGFEEIINDL